MLIVLHLSSCCLLAHIMDLGLKTAAIQRMWLCPVLILVLVSDKGSEPVMKQRDN